MISLCVPTKNRPDFLSRLLHYYAATHYQHWVCIGDSSDPEHVERNQQTVASLNSVLKIDYQLCPGLSSCAALEHVSRHLSTPYSALVCDDDFICPDGIEQCVAFLKEHPEYGAAHGKGLMLMTEQGAPYGAIGTVKSFPQPILGADTGSERLRAYLTLTPPALLYSVHRTEIWQAMFRGLSLLKGVNNRNMFKDELVASCVSVIRGKVKELDGLYLIRQPHVEDSPRFPHVYDWITDPEWFPSYQIFHDRVIEELTRQDGITMEQARVVLKQTFWPFLAHEFISAWMKQQVKVRGPSRLRHWLKRVPGLKAGWRGLRSNTERWRNALSLPALLQPSSPYHADFMPIYQIITSGSREQLNRGRIEAREVDDIAMAGSHAHD